MTISDTQKLFKQLYNIFDPTCPLEEGSPIYVDCQAVRGDVNSVIELSRDIVLSDKRNTCQLYTGHRGNGKSTELKRLAAELEKEGYPVIYFDVLDDGVDPEDARYTDILIACTRCLLTRFKQTSDRPIREWISESMQAIINLGQAGLNMAAELGGLELLTQLANHIKTVPTLRREIRRQLEPRTTTLLKVLNEFILSVQSSSPDKGLVLIADSLDRIVPIETENGEMNHDEIFVHRADQLKGLDCHVIYTVPISMLYFGNANSLDLSYGQVKVLPMIKVREKASRDPYLPGIDALKTLLEKRIQNISPDWNLTKLFEEEQTINELCLISGGNVRELVYLMRNSLKWASSSKLPITRKSVQRAIAESRETYRKMIFADHWKMLAEVYEKQSMPNRDDYRKLLYNRCVLEYRQLEPDQRITTWYDVHPLIVETEEFKRAVG